MAPSALTGLAFLEMKPEALVLSGMGRHKWFLPVTHGGGMPTLCLEVSLAFLEEGITELRPEGYKHGLESRKEPLVIP